MNIRQIFRDRRIIFFVMLLMLLLVVASYMRSDVPKPSTPWKFSSSNATHHQPPANAAHPLTTVPRPPVVAAAAPVATPTAGSNTANVNAELSDLHKRLNELAGKHSVLQDSFDGFRKEARGDFARLNEAQLAAKKKKISALGADYSKLGADLSKRLHDIRKLEDTTNHTNNSREAKAATTRIRRSSSGQELLLGIEQCAAMPFVEWADEEAGVVRLLSLEEDPAVLPPVGTDERAEVLARTRSFPRICQPDQSSTVRLALCPPPHPSSTFRQEQ